MPLDGIRRRGRGASSGPRRSPRAPRTDRTIKGSTTAAVERRLENQATSPQLPQRASFPWPGLLRPISRSVASLFIYSEANCAQKVIPPRATAHLSALEGGGAEGGKRNGRSRDAGRAIVCLGMCNAALFNDFSLLNDVVFVAFTSLEHHELWPRAQSAPAAACCDPPRRGAKFRNACRRFSRRRARVPLSRWSSDGWMAHRWGNAF
jgi:hypothetical protein